MASGQGTVTIINKKEDWNQQLNDAKSAGKIIVVDFTATWCGPCRIMAPIFADLCKKFNQLIFLKVDVDEVQDVTAQMEVRAMPTFMFIKDGEPVAKIVGANKEELERKVMYYANEGHIAA